MSHAQAAADWRKRNPEKVRRIARDYYARNPDKRKRYADLSPEQKASRVARAIAWGKNNPERFRQNSTRARWRKAGINIAEAERALQQHGGHCDCCSTDTPGGRFGWNLDHDHLTGKIRGVVCHNCNTAIGKLGDTLEGVLRAVKYLQRNQET